MLESNFSCLCTWQLYPLLSILSQSICFVFGSQLKMFRGYTGICTQELLLVSSRTIWATEDRIQVNRVRLASYPLYYLFSPSIFFFLIYLPNSSQWNWGILYQCSAIWTMCRQFSVRCWECQLLLAMWCQGISGSPKQCLGIIAILITWMIPVLCPILDNVACVLEKSLTFGYVWRIFNVY